jgi:uncharacterized membrane protein YeaQ/YmgE (transglycosylase-associated protein family)
MYPLAWVLIGVLVGWGVGRLLEGNGYGPLMDVVMGIGGAVAGGFVLSMAGYGGAMVTSLFAIVGAALLTMLMALANGRRIYARQRS